MVSPAFAVPTLINLSLSSEAMVTRLKKNEAIYLCQIARIQSTIDRIEFNRPKSGKLTASNEVLFKFATRQLNFASEGLKATRIMIDRLLPREEDKSADGVCAESDSVGRTVSDAEVVETSETPPSRE